MGLIEYKADASMSLCVSQILNCKLHIEDAIKMKKYKTDSLLFKIEQSYESANQTFTLNIGLCNGIVKAVEITQGDSFICSRELNLLSKRIKI